MSEFNFGSLSLDDARAMGGALQPGKYECKIRKAELVDTKAGNGKMLKVTFGCDDGLITEYYILAHPNDRAVRVGRDKLYTLLLRSGHPNPRHPGSVNTIVGLEVGIEVAMDGEFTRVKSYFEKPKADPTTQSFDDDEDIGF